VEHNGRSTVRGVEISVDDADVRALDVRSYDAEGSQLISVVAIRVQHDGRQLIKTTNLREDQNLQRFVLLAALSLSLRSPRSSRRRRLAESQGDDFASPGRPPSGVAAVDRDAADAKMSSAYVYGFKCIVIGDTGPCASSL